ncbi:MAG: TPM domain-containing protein, partial [Crocinitomicaceae bacterium]|nr:TPM domain-containing protein [Crocinitomicaceae bacterium]
MSKQGSFLSAEDEQEIVAAIGIAEQNTSGEIRVHIEQESATPPMERAVEIFEQLKMQHTK